MHDLIFVNKLIRYPIVNRVVNLYLFLPTHCQTILRQITAATTTKGTTIYVVYLHQIFAPMHTFLTLENSQPNKLLTAYKKNRSKTKIKTGQNPVKMNKKSIHNIPINNI